MNISLQKSSGLLVRFQSSANFLERFFEKYSKTKFHKSLYFYSTFSKWSKCPKTCTSGTTSTTKPARNALGSKPFRRCGRAV